MLKKRLIIFASSFALCLGLDLFKHNPILVSLLNSSVLIFSFLFFEIHTKSKIEINPVFWLLFAFIPLFSFNPQSLIVNILQIAVILFLIIGAKFPQLKIPFFALSVVLLIAGILLVGKLVYLNGSVDHERLIFNNPLSQIVIEDRQKNAIYLPFKIRPFVYNYSIFIYSIFNNIFQLISFKSIFDILLIANVYPLINGFIVTLKNYKKYCLIYLFLFLTLLILGINRAPDKFNSLYFVSPIFLYLILLSFKNINKKVYSALLLFSLLMSGAL